MVKILLDLDPRDPDFSSKMAESTGKYITLKEAAKLSGYAPDYVGQLIRKGKLPGKQVYSNVAWVTTEEAVQRYVSNEKNKKTESFEWRSLLKEGNLSKILNFFLYIALGVSVLFALFLFYVLVANIEANFERRALQNIQTSR